MIYAINDTENEVIVNDLGDFSIPAKSTKELTKYFDKHNLSTSDDLIKLVTDGTIKIKNDLNEILDPSKGVKTLIGEISPTQSDSLGRWYVRSDSRPKGWDIVFAGAADDLENKIIGGGKEFYWNFSNDDDLDPNPPAGFKRKILEFNFLDPILMKEGTIYYYNAPQGCYIDFYVVCPKGYPYYKKIIDESGNLKEELVPAAEQDTKIVHWVLKYHIIGSAPMGDELNTEAADENQMPPYYAFRVEITTPETDNSSYGHFSLEFYRARTIVF